MGGCRILGDGTRKIGKITNACSWDLVHGVSLHKSWCRNHTLCFKGVVSLSCEQRYWMICEKTYAFRIMGRKEGWGNSITFVRCIPGGQWRPCVGSSVCCCLGGRVWSQRLRWWWCRMWVFHIVPLRIVCQRGWRSLESFWCGSISWIFVGRWKEWSSCSSRSWCEMCSWCAPAWRWLQGRVCLIWWSRLETVCWGLRFRIVVGGFGVFLVAWLDNVQVVMEGFFFFPTFG